MHRVLAAAAVGSAVPTGPTLEAREEPVDVPPGIPVVHASASYGAPGAG